VVSTVDMVLMKGLPEAPPFATEEEALGLRPAAGHRNSQQPTAPAAVPVDGGSPGGSRATPGAPAGLPLPPWVTGGHGGGSSHQQGPGRARRAKGLDRPSHGQGRHMVRHRGCDGLWAGADRLRWKGSQPLTAPFQPCCHSCHSTFRKLLSQMTFFSVS
jgi:hypothetical protein